MEFGYLKEFVTLSEELSYSGAAEKLHTSQSTLSRHIQAFERQLGRQLFVRTTRRMILTEFGAYLLPYARHALESQDELNEAIGRWDKEESSVVEIGCSVYSHLYTMTENVIAFRRKYPNITVRPVEFPLEELTAEYEKGRFNLITMAYPNEKPVPSNMVVNGHGRLVAVIPKDDELSSASSISVSQLKNRPLLIPPIRNAFNRMFRQICANEGIIPNVVSETRIETNLRLLKEGMGVVIETRRIALQQADPDVVIVDLEPRIDFYYGLLYREKLSRNESLFVKYVRSRYA